MVGPGPRSEARGAHYSRASICLVVPPATAHRLHVAGCQFLQRNAALREIVRVDFVVAQLWLRIIGKDHINAAKLWASRQSLQS